MQADEIIENAIEVKSVTKCFKVYKDKSRNLKDKVIFWDRNKYKTRTVLKDISFSIPKGQAVGLIGHNGCGKSTTLKLLTRIMYPDSGEIKICGRVSSLLELGAGFHPDLSGKDNVYINASVFGLTRSEIDAKLDEIITFSELENFIDNPVRTYSSGMYMRLAFSVAINVNADIILVDEILAVGDTSFQAKCLKKLREIKESGVTIVIVSHSLEQIESFCDRSIWLNEGMIAGDGTPREVHRNYLEFMDKYHFNDTAASDEEKAEHEKLRQDKLRREAEAQWKKRFERSGNGDVRIDSVTCRGSDGKEGTVFRTGEKLTFSIKYHVSRETDLNIYFGIIRIDYFLCYATTLYEELNRYIHVRNDGEIRIELPVIDLLPNRYLLDIRLYNRNGMEVDIFNEAVKWHVVSDTKEQGLYQMDHHWSFDGIE